MMNQSVMMGTHTLFTLGSFSRRAYREFTSVLCDDLDGSDGGGVGWGEREVSKGREVCVHEADSLHYAAETNTAL